MKFYQSHSDRSSVINIAEIVITDQTLPRIIYLIYLYLHPIDHMGHPHLDVGVVNNIWYLHNMC